MNGLKRPNSDHVKSIEWFGPPMNIFDLVLSNNQNNGAKKALSMSGCQGKTQTVSYSEMFTEVNLLAGRLSEQGMCRGDRIALIAENSPAWNMAFLAILKTRCTAVLLDASLTASDLSQQIGRSDVRCILASPRIMEKLSDAVPLELTLLDLSRHGASFRATTRDGSLPLPQTTDGDENIAAIIYSSGTTRIAAGIMHSHEALVASTLMCAQSNHLTSDGKYLAVVPNSHIYGLICSVLGPLLLGADVHFIELSSADAIIKAFAEYRPTIFPCVPRVFELFKTEIDKKVAGNAKKKSSLICFSPSAWPFGKKPALIWVKSSLKASMRVSAGESKSSVQPVRPWIAAQPSFIWVRALTC